MTGAAFDAGGIANKPMVRIAQSFFILLPQPAALQDSSQPRQQSPNSLIANEMRAEAAARCRFDSAEV
jgi:hypothetical protein